MSETPTRLNLIQRAMQRTAPVQKPALTDRGGTKQPNVRHSDVTLERASSKQKQAINDAPSITRWEAEPAQNAGAAEPVHLDYTNLRASRIATSDNKSSATYNEFRSLKRKLIPMTRDPETGAMTRNLVMVTSALPREGKTFTVMNLAIGLAAERNLNVVLVDGDVVRGSIAEFFHGENKDGLVELLTEKRLRIDELLHPCADLPGLHVLFAGKRDEATPELLASRRMGEICAALSKHLQHSIILFDTPPILAASEPAAMAVHAHHLIMLVAAGQATRHQVEAALTEVSSCPNISLVFNRALEWERPIADSYYYYGAGEKSAEA